MLFLFAAAILMPQDGERKKFDDLVRLLEDDSLEVREEAARSLTRLGPPADAWLREAAEKAHGERQARLRGIIADRHLAAEIARLARLGISEKSLRAHPDLSRRLEAKDPAERTALLAEVSGVRLNAEAQDPDDYEEVPGANPMAPAEIGVVAELALALPLSRELQWLVIAVADHLAHRSMLGALRILMRDPDASVRLWSFEALASTRGDLTSAAPEVLQVLVTGDDTIRARASSLVRQIDWSGQFEGLVAVLPRLTPRP